MELDNDLDNDIQQPAPVDVAPEVGTGDNEPEEIVVRRVWDETATDALKDPGGAIPDLPVWEEPDAAFRRAEPPPHNASLRLVPRQDPPPETAGSPSLIMRASVSLAECTKLCEQLTREWRALELVPTLDDVVLRAAARAFREVWGSEARLGLRRIDGGSEQIALLAGAHDESFRIAVTTLAGSSREEVAADLVVTSFLNTSVEQADPRLDDGYFAITIGAERVGVVLERNQPVNGPVTTLSLAYAPDSVPDSVAADLLGRVCQLVEAPYALLAD